MATPPPLPFLPAPAPYQMPAIVTEDNGLAGAAERDDKHAAKQRRSTARNCLIGLCGHERGALEDTSTVSKNPQLVGLACPPGCRLRGWGINAPLTALVSSVETRYQHGRESAYSVAVPSAIGSRRSLKQSQPITARI